MIRLTRLTLLAVTALAAVASARADLYTIGSTVNLTVDGVSPRETVRINASGLGTVNVYAGLVDLTIAGIGKVDALCIDPFQWASNGTFTVAGVSSAPVNRPMGANAANLVSKLWALNYENAKTSSTTAASLQLAVWEVVGGTSFTFIADWVPANLGAISNQMILDATAYNGPGAKLVALTNRTSQDFVVEQVPDGGATVLLLGLGLTGLAILRRRA